MTELLALFGILESHRVEYIIIVGGVAAVLNGVPLMTFDCDIVHRQSPENVEHLLHALHSLEARYRNVGDRILEPDATHLFSRGHQLLLTKFGPLDVLGRIGLNWGFEDLYPHTRKVKVSEDVVVRVLDLPKLIETKEQAGREKDKAVLNLMKRTLEERTAGQSPGGPDNSN